MAAPLPHVGLTERSSSRMMGQLSATAIYAEANVSAKKEKARNDARVSRAEANARWSPSAATTASKGARAALSLRCASANALEAPETRCAQSNARARARYHGAEEPSFCNEGSLWCE
jgi:hypothetical protein